MSVLRTLPWGMELPLTPANAYSRFRFTSFLLPLPALAPFLGLLITILMVCSHTHCGFDLHFPMTPNMGQMIIL